MSREKFTKPEINLIVKRAIRLFGFKNQGQLGEYFGLSRSSTSNKKTTQTIIDLIEKEAYKRNLNFDYIISGKDKPLKIGEPKRKYGLPPLNSEEQNLITKAHEIIASKTAYRKILISNIDTLYKAMKGNENGLAGNPKERK